MSDSGEFSMHCERSKMYNEEAVLLSPNRIQKSVTGSRVWFSGDCAKLLKQNSTTMGQPVR